ncbi:hypothetical protein EN41_21440 [Agrobacterium tumefaciens]|uniref:Uncharacterized protein n=1 Tax=Agrobacterium fabrum (strain C58 / ATCC 33970) TaxID=176299 RepID=Q7CVU1_AGRFC|nr:hypothetical protein [Agrobacterium fabrum]KEY54030.1 hypothetical protein EN41_21440 [Agrobacterium tumefaciens]AAK88678.2 hypothetical protein Atu4772 [Agrobacterium fabrum str. C58]KJX85654.1 hypothetical protein SY94_4731 [Agrobacterium tumefaciens]MCX2876539.1 hypothetical protein [Agrobacterium fabrum]NMV71901.1 hypothetical protein [Agrobacterium fabrum]
MTSISQNADERQPRHLKVAAVLALGAIAVLGGNALLIRNTEPALAASEDVASASAFRILTPQTIDRLAGLSAPAATGGNATGGVAVPAADKTSCVATRAARKTDRHDTLDPKAFCQLQHRLFNAELIDRIAVLQLASQPRFIDTSSQLAMNKEF